MNVHTFDANKVYEAAYDYKYLLSRGYPIKSSLDLVVVRYSLNKKERLLLHRCVHPHQYIDEIKKKLMCGSLQGYVLLIDFYNILISAINMLKGGEVYMCDDCVPRDLRGSKLHKDDDPYIDTAMILITRMIKIMRPRHVVLVIDKNISFSYNHAIRFKSILDQLNIKSSYEMSSTPDKKLIDYSTKTNEAVIATSDSIIMMNCPKIVPITLGVMYLLNITPLYNFAGLFNFECSICFDNLIQTIHKNYECSG